MNSNCSAKVVPEKDEVMAVGAQDLIVYEFKIDGMTCVACSSAIERGMIGAFKDKGLVPKDGDSKKYEVDVILLMHKMKITFVESVAVQNGVTGAGIADEVECIGFGA